MATITTIKGLQKAVQKYDLVHVSSYDYHGDMHMLFARRGSGTRGGRYRNLRLVILMPSQRCEADRLGLIGKAQF